MLSLKILTKAITGHCLVDGLQVTGHITYNGRGFDQFRASHTAAYVDQNDLHQPELTVRETFDFAARCQGVGTKAGEASLSSSAHCSVKHRVCVLALMVLLCTL